MTSSSSSSQFDAGDDCIEATWLLVIKESTEAFVSQSSDGVFSSDSDSSQDSSLDYSVITIEDRMIERLNVGRLQHGCVHYRRRCRIRAPCCNEIFDCRHCHNEAKNDLQICGQEKHDLPRHEVENVICSLCKAEQQARQVCVHCGVRMGEYYCDKCKLWDDDVTKEQYHCDGCGICRIGGHTNFFHCQRCGCCYANVLKDGHACVERAMHHNCPVCFEFLFESTKGIFVMPCGHTIHWDCVKEMQAHFQFACPLCSKSVWDMSRIWERLDEELATMPMSELYQNKIVWILCNDCGVRSEVQFHVLARKCLNCKSYNTRQINSSAAAHPCRSGDN